MVNKKTRDTLMNAVNEVRPGATVNPLRFSRTTAYRYMKQGYIRKSGSFLQLTEKGARALGWAPPKHEPSWWERVVLWFKERAHG